jgi:serine/threonine protein kinase
VSDDRWPRLKALFQAAVDLSADERAAFLAAATGTNTALRREVEALLASDRSDTGFLDRLPAARASVVEDALVALHMRDDPAESRPILTAGVRIGVYEIVAPLGAGAMGEVYRARDTKLNRDVALKVLPERFALAPDRAARFTREAQLLATLSHPNVGAIYGLEESNGTRALVLELIDGTTLADRIARGPLAWDEALTIARQVAGAIEAAHEKGIVHRDLKPANIKLTNTGGVKVLDFGLAKVLDGAAAAAGPASPVLTAAGSQERVILGTPAYMSPEQARGQPLDKRTDIWAFGCVLYEMLAGRAPFAGQTVADTLAAILEREPDWSALPATVPAFARTLIRRCLEKDRRQRIADISVAQFVLDEPLSAAPPPAARFRLWQASAAVSVLTTVALDAQIVWSSGTPAQASRFDASLPEGTTLYAYVSVSPDGRKLAFTDSGGAGHTKSLWIRDFGTLEWRRLPGTELATSPFWTGQPISGVRRRKSTEEDRRRRWPSTDPLFHARVGGRLGSVEPGWRDCLRQLGWRWWRAVVEDLGDRRLRHGAYRGGHSKGRAESHVADVHRGREALRLFPLRSA